MNTDNKTTTVLFDLDNTITRFDTYRVFLLYVLLRRPLRWITVLWLPVAVIMHASGVRDNQWLKETFLKAIVSGSDRNRVNEWSEEFVHWLIKRGIRKSALEAIRRHRAAGHRLWLVTASFDFYAILIQQQLAMDVLVCTRSSWSRSDMLQGNIDGKNCYGREKLNRIKACFETERDYSFLIAYSDHHSDLPLLEWVDQPVAVNPSAKLRGEAVSRGWEIQEW